jgi:hypothetical protein
MKSRPVIIAAALGATIGVPYLASRMPSAPSPAASPPTAAATLSPTATTTPPPVAPPTPPPNQGPGSLVSASPAPLEGAGVRSIEQVLRFDLTKDWVYRTWARKSTGPTDVGLFAVRVPLMTGTQTSSLAGSLTYFFNTYGQIEHISFRGRTGDATPLVNFLMRTYEFQRVAAPVGEQVYQVKRRGRVQSELRTQPAPVLWAAAPHSSIAVELELARPGSKRFLPPRGPYLAIPQAASNPLPAPSTSATASTSGDAEGESGGGSFLDKFRHASPQEESQVLWKRWPN